MTTICNLFETFFVPKEKSTIQIIKLCSIGHTESLWFTSTMASQVSEQRNTSFGEFYIVKGNALYPKMLVIQCFVEEKNPGWYEDLSCGFESVIG